MPQKVEITTPENIGLEYEIAGLGSRAAAIMIDSLIQAAIVIVIGLVAIGVMAKTGGIGRLDAPGRFLDSSWTLALIVLAAEIAYNGYFLVFESLWKGQTPGKKAINIRVIMDDGRALSFRAALIRNLLRAADSIPGLYWLGIVVAFVNSSGKRVGDIAAGTVVVKMAWQHPPVPQADGPARTPPNAAEHVAAQSVAAYMSSSRLSLDAQQKAARLDPKEVEAIRYTIQRSAELAPDVAERLSRSMAEKVGEKLEIGLEQTELGPQAFLTEVLRAWDVRNSL